MTLIEIMIALALGVALLGGVLKIFQNSNQTYRMQDNMSRLQENGRFAMDFLSRDIRMTDFWGCLKLGLVNVTNNLNSSGASYNADIHNFSLDQGITGTNGTVHASIAALDAPDSINLKAAYANGLTVETPFGPSVSSAIHIPADSDLEQSDVVVVSDCTTADVFQISNANPDDGELDHYTGNSTTPGNYQAATLGCPGANTHCFSKVYQGDASVYKVAATIYSIQNGASGQPALFRKINGDAAVELVEGIENMQILYGADTNDDFTPDYYVPAGTAGLNMANVVSVRVSVLVSTYDNLAASPVPYTFNGATTTPADRKLRRVFSSTFAIRNRLQ
ncbi:MAG: PilW family protein [Methylococcales bacterium]|nr:PilW family protein [Methylococcales bacterium]